MISRTGCNLPSWPSQRSNDIQSTRTTKNKKRRKSTKKEDAKYISGISLSDISKSFKINLNDLKEIVNRSS